MSQGRKCIILNLGTNNWQRPKPNGEIDFAPGSGILHEQHARTFNDNFTFTPATTGKTETTLCYNIYPSNSQRPSKEAMDKDRYRVFELDHQIPICESVSPVSSLRWHSFTEDRFQAYLKRLADLVESYLNEIEAKEKQDVNFFIGNHCFTNPVILTIVNERRLAAGKSRVPITVMAHGTALKMYENEIASAKQGSDEYPLRFMPWIEKLGIFDKRSPNCVDGVFVISKEQDTRFRGLFPHFDNVIVAENSYNQLIFRPPTEKANLAPATATIFRELKPIFCKPLLEAVSPAKKAELEGIANTTLAQLFQTHSGPTTKLVVFCGKFADWKRVPVVLKAAAAITKTRKDVVFALMGSGPEDSIEAMHRLAFEKLNISPTSLFFLGPQPHNIIAQVNGAAAVGVTPSKDEPFGLVIIEQMGCQCPVIAVASGGPKNFVKPEVGYLVAETDSEDKLAQDFTTKITEALDQDWKNTGMGERSAKYALTNYSTANQLKVMLTAASEWIDARNSKKNGGGVAPTKDSAVTGVRTNGLMSAVRRPDEVQSKPAAGKDESKKGGNPAFSLIALICIAAVGVGVARHFRGKL